ncbi:MAG TPA: hypothetical protein ENN19_18455 [Chloroflexi bacterium]|nr:hypothetical protein [Chloroflexota bacterium]
MANFLKTRWAGIKQAWPAAALALLCGVFYWDVLRLPSEHIIAGKDLVNMFYHWLNFAVSSVKQGQLPLWNPHLFSGIPFVANPQPALFYPPTWLAFFMPVSQALGWIIVLHVWLAGVGVYLWLRSEGASTWGALTGGVVFAFSGYTFVRVAAGHLGVVTTGAWLPFVLWAYRRAIVPGPAGWWRRAVLGGIPVALSVLAGHTATFVYVALGLGGYAAFYAWDSWRCERTARMSVEAATRALTIAGVMVGVGLALAAVQLFPLVELVTRSTRDAVSGYDFAARFSWPPGYLLTLLAPNFFGEPTHTGYWGGGVYEEFIFYVGVLPLLLALLGLRLRHRLTAFLAILGGGALLLGLGKYGLLHPLFYRFVPLFESMRAPARAGFLFTLAAAALTGLVVTALQAPGSAGRDDEVNEVQEKNARQSLLAPLTGSLMRGVAMGAAGLIALCFTAFAWGRESNPAAGRLWHLANQVALFLLFFLLSVGLLTAWRRASGRAAHFGALALGLVLLDLWTFGASTIQPAALDQVVEGQSYWRAVAQVVEETAGETSAARVLPWGLNDFLQNGGMPLDLHSVFGYDPLILQRYETFITSRPDPLARTYDLLNTRYLVSGVKLDFAELSEAESEPPLLLEESGVYVYERPDVLPRAWIVQDTEILDDAATLARIHDPDFDPRQTALVASAPACVTAYVTGDTSPETTEVVSLRDEGNRIEARVQGAGGLLVFSEVDYPGWRATVDGVSTPLVRVDYVLRALCVPPGEHRVTMVYDPPSLKIGAAVTGLTLLLVAALGIGAVRGSRITRMDT